MTMLQSIRSERLSGARARIYRAALRLFAESGGSEITVSDLADAAGIARGTIYNNIAEPDNLFGEVAIALSHEMLLRTEATMQGFTDPAERIATGARLFIRRAAEEQDWGRFLVRFSHSHAVLQEAMRDPPARDIKQAVKSGRFKIGADKIPALLSMLAGATIAAMNAVISGNQTWRDAGSGTAELLLRAGGIAPTEARRIAQRELPPLAHAQHQPRKRKTS